MLDQLAVETDRQRPPQWIDYFVFSRGLYYQQIPEFVVGRPGWDNWLLWYPLSIGVPVVDASRVVRAVHQNHDYGYHPEGEKGVWEGEEAQENYRLHEGEIRYFGECFAFAYESGDSAELWGCVDFGSAVCGGGVVLGLVWVVEFDATGAALVGSA